MRRKEGQTAMSDERVFKERGERPNACWEGERCIHDAENRSLGSELFCDATHARAEFETE